MADRGYLAPITYHPFDGPNACLFRVCREAQSRLSLIVAGPKVPDRSGYLLPPVPDRSDLFRVGNIV